MLVIRIQQTAVQSLCPSHIHTLPQGSSQSVSHIWNNAGHKNSYALHLESRLQYLSLQVAPELESSTLALLFVLHNSKGQRTEASLTELSLQHRDAFVCRGLPVIFALRLAQLYFIQQTQDRLRRHKVSHPVAVNSLVMRAW